MRQQVHWAGNCPYWLCHVWVIAKPSIITQLLQTPQAGANAHTGVQVFRTQMMSPALPLLCNTAGEDKDLLIDKGHSTYVPLAAPTSRSLQIFCLLRVTRMLVLMQECLGSAFRTFMNTFCWNTVARVGEYAEDFFSVKRSHTESARTCVHCIYQLHFCTTRFLLTFGWYASKISNVPWKH